ncbi:hypothetical protein [Methanococcoides sp. FTZ1]|uniref:hypothetical protein n=1 Tax=Methanococcoides sp. FTZ1 TaxID=3439061 RepID=UPI003F829640
MTTKIEIQVIDEFAANIDKVKRPNETREDFVKRIINSQVNGMIRFGRINGERLPCAE